MTVSALRVGFWSPPLRLPHNATLRALTLGTVWGLFLSVGLLGVSFYACGTICAAQALVTTAMSVLAGIATIAPVVVLSGTN